MKRSHKQRVLEKRWARRRQPASPRGRLWLLFLLASPFSTSGQTAFSDKSSLQAGLAAWCRDPTAHSDMNTWDVSAVTDMYNLMTEMPPRWTPWSCLSTFNEDINSWNMGQVTNTGVRRRPIEPHTDQLARGAGRQRC